ncbi:helix-turn-helix domain-containing protein [Nocardioides sp. WG-D5]
MATTTTTNHTNNNEEPRGGPTRLLTLEEAADQLRISVDSLLRAANYGQIATVRIGRRRLIDPADLEAFITESREEYQR